MCVGVSGGSPGHKRQKDMNDRREEAESGLTLSHEFSMVMLLWKKLFVSLLGRDLRLLDERGFEGSLYSSGTAYGGGQQWQEEGGG